MCYFSRFEYIIGRLRNWFILWIYWQPSNNNWFKTIYLRTKGNFQNAIVRSENALDEISDPNDGYGNWNITNSFL